MVIRWRCQCELVIDEATKFVDVLVDKKLDLTLVGGTVAQFYWHWSCVFFPHLEPKGRIVLGQHTNLQWLEMQ